MSLPRGSLLSAGRRRRRRSRPLRGGAGPAAILCRGCVRSRGPGGGCCAHARRRARRSGGAGARCCRASERGAMGLGSNSAVRVEWVAAVSLAAGAAAVGYLAYRKFLSKDKCCKAMVNLHIQKDNPKVVHAFDMEDLGDKAVYCRCWRSKKFPLCDGSHTKHNDETGDNVGPLIIKRKEA
ncbi:CDGSH iron-sulfur domain-containing protein 1 [Struthio camelus]